MKIELTKYSHGAGCGCKISPKVLEKILHFNHQQTAYPNLLVGHETNDDAAVFDLGNGTSLISTADFFMPIVDDPFDFGQIASANALSDVYAMGGTPLMAISILGWPVEKLNSKIASDVLKGSRKICTTAGIPLAGGHSIDNPEPIFGLAVTGKIKNSFLKKNSTATAGCKLFLTKPLGVGILSTAQKKKLLKSEHATIARDWMVKLNQCGETFGKLSFVKAMTDVTGFGLLGHLIEMCDGSNLSAEINFENVPVIPEVFEYLNQPAIPGGMSRNWESYGQKVAPLTELQKKMLCDPQTSGGLLVAVEPNSEANFVAACKNLELKIKSFGQLIERVEFAVRIL